MPADSVSESDGLKKLIEYLNQTKRQAESAIDILNSQIKEISIECEKYKDESIYYKRCSEQLQQENSKKWRLNERDDWKSLVDSVQKDRSRLQDDCLKLEIECDQYKQQLLQLQIQLEEETRKSSSTSTVSGISTENNAVNKVYESPSNNTTTTPSTSTLFFETPSKLIRSQTDSSGLLLFNNNSHSHFPEKQDNNLIIKTMQTEMEKMRQELEVATRSYEAELLAQHAEIQRLHEELSYYKQQHGHQQENYSQSFTTTNTSSSTFRHQDTNSMMVTNGGKYSHYSPPSSSWSIFDFFFGTSSKSKKISDEILHL